MSSGSDKALAKTARELPRGLATVLQRAATNLFALEVTTIVQDDIPASRMPPPADAMRDLARMYDKKMSAMSPSSPPAPVKAKAKAKGKDAKGKDGMPAFDEMSERARVMMDEMEPSGKSPEAGRSTIVAGTEASADAAILQRIMQNSEELMSLSRKMESPAADLSGESDGMHLTPDELMRLHMMWHTGVEHIAIKTVIQVTGDVITRIRPEYLGEQGRALVEIHHSAIKTSVDFWKSLVDVLERFVVTLGSFFSNRSS